MIVIERTWKEPDSRGGGKLNQVARKCFADDVQIHKVVKANEAPEKIWIDNLDEGFWFDSPSGNKSIGYIRTDVFIEKVIEFINKANLYLYHCISEECDYVDTDKFIKDFKKYIKEEQQN